MQTLYLLLSAIGAVSAVSFWPLSGAFVNWFWQDEKEEAEMVLADKRSSTNYSKEISLAAMVAMLAILSISGLLLYLNSTPADLFIIKSLAIIYFLFLGLVDIRTMMLPDILNYIGLWFGLILACFNLNPFGISIQSCVLGAFGCYLACWLIIQFGYKILKKAIIGHGDAKYLAMLGAWFGFKIAYLNFAFAMVLATLFAILRIIFIRGTELNAPTPFGPFLSCSAIIMFIYYKPIVMYMHESYPSIF